MSSVSIILRKLDAFEPNSSSTAVAYHWLNVLKVSVKTVCTYFSDKNWKIMGYIKDPYDGRNGRRVTGDDGDSPGADGTGICP